MIAPIQRHVLWKNGRDLPASLKEQVPFQAANFSLFPLASPAATRTCVSDEPGGAAWEDKVPANARQSEGTAPVGGHHPVFNGTRRGPRMPGRVGKSRSLLR